MNFLGGKFDFFQVQKYSGWLFVGLVAFIFLCIHLYDVFLMPPHGIHFWRQTDSLAFVEGFYLFDADLLHPKILNTGTIDGRAAAEFPIVYYITALLYSVFGRHEIILRLLTYAVYLGGFYAFFRIAEWFLKNSFLAVAVSLLFLFGGVPTYYATGFIPDPVALGLVLMGAYSYLLFISNRTKAKLVLAIALFTLSALVKVTLAILPLALFGLLLLSVVLKHFDSYFPHKRLQLLLFLLSFIAVFAWYRHAVIYNEANDCVYFLTHINPIWKYSLEENLETWKVIRRSLKTAYALTVWHVWGCLVLICLPFVRRMNPVLQVTNALLFAGALAYLALFWGQLRVHDYYLFAVIPAVLFLFLSCVDVLTKLKWKRYSVSLLFVILSALTYHQADETKHYMRYFMNRPHDFYSSTELILNGIDAEFDRLGVATDEKVLVVGEHTTSAAHYFIKRQGRILPDTSASGIADLKECINQGLRCIVLKDSSYFQNSYLANLKQFELFRYNSAVVLMSETGLKPE